MTIAQDLQTNRGDKLLHIYRQLAEISVEDCCVVRRPKPARGAFEEDPWQLNGCKSSRATVDAMANQVYATRLDY